MLVWLLLIGLFANQAQTTGPVQIESAPGSGVAGYSIGIFGSGFGPTQGTGRVTVGGAEADVLGWRDQMIRVVIPPVRDGPTSLVVETNGGSAAWRIVIYSVDPSFTTRVAEMQNIAPGKGVYYSAPMVEMYIGPSPSRQLSRNDAPNPGYLICPPGQIFAVDLGQPLDEEVWWVMYGGTDGWPPFDGSGRAMKYTIEGSRDSTNGQDGAWQVLHSTAYNERITVVHKVKLAGHSWIRMKVGATLGNQPFRVFEIRVYQRRPGQSNDRVDSLAVIGDSLTHGDFSPLEAEAFFPAILAQASAADSEIVFYPVGLVGAQANILAAGNREEWALPRILAQTPDIDLWGFAFGTNDSLSEWDARNYQQFLREGIEQVVALGKAPMVARMPDTGPMGFGSPASKALILSAIDALNAEYRLIPGPDLYTAFRRNILYEGMTYLSDDQTHHSPAGRLAVQRMWAGALVNAGIYQDAGLGGRAEPPPGLCRLVRRSCQQRR